MTHYFRMNETLTFIQIYCLHLIFILFSFLNFVVTLTISTIFPLSIFYFDHRPLQTRMDELLFKI